MAYLDNILVYIRGLYYNYIAKVRIILERLHKAGLYLDLKKYKFAVKQVKYLGYSIVIEKKTRFNPEKVAAICD